MPEIACDTSALQYLHQLGALEILPALSERVLIPPAVVAELEAGRSKGVDLPDPAAIAWIHVEAPAGVSVVGLATDLGAGEGQVLALGIDRPNLVVILDDRLARRLARQLGIKHTGTLGLLLDAKRKGLIPEVRPMLERLQELGFRIHPRTRSAVLDLAGEHAA